MHFALPAWLPRALAAPLLPLVLVLGTLAPAAGQQAMSDSARVSALLREANRGSWHVRVRHVDGRTAEGRAEWRGPGAIEVGERSVRPDSVLRVERRLQRGGGARSGFLAGWALGSLAIFGTLAGLCDAGSSCPGVRGVVAAAAAGALVGGAPGALVGGLLKPAEVVWVPLWPAP